MSDASDSDVPQAPPPTSPATTNRPDWVMPMIATDVDQKSLNPDTLETRRHYFKGSGDEG